MSSIISETVEGVVDNINSAAKLLKRRVSEMELPQLQEITVALSNITNLVSQRHSELRHGSDKPALSMVNSPPAAPATPTVGIDKENQTVDGFSKSRVLCQLGVAGVRRAEAEKILRALGFTAGSGWHAYLNPNRNGNKPAELSSARIAELRALAGATSPALVSNPPATLPMPKSEPVPVPMASAAKDNGNKKDKTLSPVQQLLNVMREELPELDNTQRSEFWKRMGTSTLDDVDLINILAGVKSNDYVWQRIQKWLKANVSSK